MYTFRIKFDHSNDGKRWSTTCTSVKATSELAAYEQIRSRYPYVKNISTQSVR